MIKRICIFTLFILLLSGCATYPVYRNWTKGNVINWLEGARDSHIRNRGSYNSKTFDDMCVRDYNGIIDWIEKNSSNK